MNRFLFVLLFIIGSVWAAPGAIVTYVTGKAFVQGPAQAKAKTLKAQAKVKSGQSVTTRPSTRVELTFATGSVLRIDENSEVRIEEGAGITIHVTKGSVWSHIRKLGSGLANFNVITPRATAAVRGTVFDVQCKQDSSVRVDLYAGRVDVGPSDTTKFDPQAWGEAKPVPGPSAVSLDTWFSLSPGQSIQVQWDGSYVVQGVDEGQSDWRRFNLERDALLTQTAK
jgi:hypothetical protein